MATATPVKATDAGTSLTKAAMGFDLRQSQPHQQCVSRWINKHRSGCLA